MGAALVLLLVGLGAMAAGVLIGRYYVPDDRQLRRTARHSRAYMRALSHLLARDHDTVVSELRSIVEENVEDVEPYFALGSVFRSRGEHERAIRVHQALAVRERDRRKLRQRAMYELGLDFRAAGMPRRTTRAMEEVLLEEPDHEGALRVLAALYEEQARFNEAAELWQRLGRRRGESTSHREHHLLVAAAQSALARDDLDSAKQLLKAAQKLEESAHFFAAAAELAAGRHHHQGAKERLKQALIADPALVPHLLPGLIAAEQGLAHAGEGEGADKAKDGDEFDDAELAASQLEAAEVPQLAGRSTLALPSTTGAASSPAAASASGGVGSASATSAPGAVASGSGAAAARTQIGLVATPATPAPAPSAPSAAGSVAGEAASMPATASAGASSAVSAAGSVAGEAASMPATASAGASSAPSAAASTPGEAAATPTAMVTAPVVRRNRTVEIPALAGESRPSGPATKAPSSSLREHGVAGSGNASGETLDAGVVEGVLAVLAEVEAQSGPRLEIALIRAQLVPPGDATTRAALVNDLMARFPAALAARVAAARLALTSDDLRMIRGALDALVSDSGAIAWALRGRWQCTHCGHRPGPFSWRCGQCRRWDTLRMETGIEPPPMAPRERRAAPRSGRPDGLLGATPDEALPAPTLDPGLSDAELASGGARRSLLGKVGGWVSGLWRRDAT